MLARLREDIASVFDRDPAARNSFEILTTYRGQRRDGTPAVPPPMGSGLKWPARFLSNTARLLTGIEIHPGARSAGASSSTTAWGS